MGVGRAKHVGEKRVRAGRSHEQHPYSPFRTGVNRTCIQFVHHLLWVYRYCCWFILETVWNIWVWTSDMRGAGTDSNVFVTLYGDKGKTDEVPMGNATDNFEQGQLDKFKV